MTVDEFKEKLFEMRNVGPSPVNRPDSGGPLSIDPIQMKQIDDMVKKMKDEGESCVLVHLATHEIKTALVGNRKNPEVTHFNRYSYMEYSKYFFDRPSAQGFKNGLGLKMAKPAFNNYWLRDFDTAMQLPMHDNTQEIIVCLDGIPFYARKGFHIFLKCIGLHYFSIFLILWAVPGLAACNCLGSRGKRFHVKMAKMMLY
jgi:hypothetical protein